MVIEDDRIVSVGRERPAEISSNAQIINAKGKYVIPGLMDANVHLLLGATLEQLSRYEGRYEDLILGAAQLTLKGGVTTVFYSWGPLRHLRNVRDDINQGRLEGSRIYFAGNIVGVGGPFSEDFYSKSMGVASNAFAKRLTETWEQNVGPDLMWINLPQFNGEDSTP